MNRRHERAARASARAIVLGVVAVASLVRCSDPLVGAPSQSGQTSGAPSVEITGASVGASGQVLVSLRVTAGGVPISKAQLASLRPTFTLAALSRHPVDGIWAWRSFLPTGTQTIPQLPPAGPGTAPVLVNQQQPGSESTGTLSGDAGSFTYLFANAVPADFVSTETLRVGVWLGLAAGTPATNDTYDFVPAGGTAAPRDVVLDAACDACHGAVSAHGGRRVGVKICTTCHTWQQADPDTVDPAALDGATTATDPNPLELGRMIHRIHRGKNLPTLYQSASSALSTAPPFAAAPPAPFLAGRNAALVGRKYAIVGYQGREFVFGRIATRTDNFMPARTLAEGVTFPRDLRDCDACHAGAPQAYEVLYAISRRTCSGCHPDVWFQDAPITDLVHLGHTGGPQADDGDCRGCHVAPTAAQPTTWVRITDAHVPPRRSPYYDKPSIEIVSVSNMKRGAAPTIVFRVRDRVSCPDPSDAARCGSIETPLATAPSNETAGVAPSPVPRKFPGGIAPGLRIVLTGPTAPDYDMPQILSSDVTGTPSALVNADLCAQSADATGAITYTFTETLPASASGTWAVLFEGRRSAAVPFYDVASQTFRWPYTGEAVYESPDNAIAYVDTATGAWTAAAPGAAVPRRKVVAEERCLACHGRFELHGYQRHAVESCLACHSPQRTDWVRRPKLAGGNVNLSATFDGLEERSVHLKVLVHRIHTGGATGAASLEAIEPHVVYGYGGNPYFFDEGAFPAPLGNCTLCHVGTSYRVDSVPADAPPTTANENPTTRHAGTSAHVAGEQATPPVQAACLGCHANGFAAAHAAGHTAGGVEQCAQCHVRGTYAVDVVHGLAPEGAPLVSASFGSIAQAILVPRCASAACHGGNPPPAFPRLDADAAYDAIVNVDSQQASGVKLVKPYDPAASYLLLKMRGEAASVGGLGTPMPIGDALLDASDLAAFEAWIANGAPND